MTTISFFGSFFFLFFFFSLFFGWGRGVWEAMVGGPRRAYASKWDLRIIDLLDLFQDQIGQPLIHPQGSESATRTTRYPCLPRHDIVVTGRCSCTPKEVVGGQYCALEGVPSKGTPRKPSAF